MADAVAVIVQYPTIDGVPGAEYECESAALAKQAHPDAAIVRFAATQEPYKAGAKPTPVGAVAAPVATPAEQAPDAPGQSMSTKGKA